MELDLFSSKETHLKSIPIEDGKLFFVKKLPLPYPNIEIFNRLANDTLWRTESVNIWGKTFTQPRLIAWYGDEGKSYKYSGNLFKPLAWTPLLLAIKEQVEKTCDVEFNSVLLNYYRDSADSMGFHSDNEPELGETPNIASLSLGETRQFVFKHKYKKELKPIRINLDDGNLILMSGEIQKNWAHGIPKETKKCGPRINLTFRFIYSKPK